MRSAEKNGRLSLKEIADALGQLELESEDIDKLYETLENMGVEIETGDAFWKRRWATMMTTKARSSPRPSRRYPEEELIDTSAMAETFAIDDPVRMYLKEIGKVDLLTPEEEVTLAEQMQKGNEAKAARIEAEGDGDLLRRSARSWIRTSSWATRRKSVWRRRTCVWWSRSPSAMSAAACCSST